MKFVGFLSCRILENIQFEKNRLLPGSWLNAKSAKYFFKETNKRKIQIEKFAFLEIKNDYFGIEKIMYMWSEHLSLVICMWSSSFMVYVCVCGFSKVKRAG